MRNQLHGNPHIFIIILIEPCPQKRFMPTAKTTPQAFCFTNVEQSISPVSDRVDTRTRRNIFKSTAQGLALLKWGEGDRIQNSSGLGLQFRLIRWHRGRHATCMVGWRLLYHLEFTSSFLQLDRHIFAMSAFLNLRTHLRFIKDKPLLTGSISPDGSLLGHRHFTYNKNKQVKPTKRRSEHWLTSGGEFSGAVGKIIPPMMSRSL